MAVSLHPERVEALGTSLEFRDGRATGRCAGPVCAGQVKAQRLRDRVGAGALATAFGDTSPDAYLLELSREAVAICPDEGAGPAGA